MQMLMEYALATSLLFVAAEPFAIKCISVRQEPPRHFNPAKFGDPLRALSADIHRTKNDRLQRRPGVSRTSNSGSRTSSHGRLCVMFAVDQGMDCDSRIAGDPEALTRWFCSIGGTLGPVVLEETLYKGWGLRAERDLEVGETLAVIPRSACIGFGQRNSGIASNSTKSDESTGRRCLEALTDHVPEQFADVRLGLVLLHERFKTGSKWEAYIQNLPEKFRGIPLSSFSAVDIRALQDRDLAMAIDERCKFFVEFLKDVSDPLSTRPDAPFGERRVTFGDLAWATCAVSSRAFTHLQSGGRDESKPLLVPFMDMVNFRFERSNVKLVPAPLSDGDTQGGIDDEMPDHSEVRMVATRPIAAGESLEMQENSTNAERLCKYGFVDINRRHERNPFRFEKKILRAARMAIGILDEPFGAQFEQDAVEPWQQRVLSELRLDGYNADLEVYLGGESTRGKLPVDGRLVAGLRVMFSRNKKELEGKSAEQLCSYKAGELSNHVEERVLATVIGLGLIYVQKWPTTLTNDEVILFGRTDPDIEAAWQLPPPWQVLAEEDMTPEDTIQPGVAKQAARSDCDRENGDKDGQSWDINDAKAELSWEMVQAVAYRLAKKRTLMDVGLIANAELQRLGTSSGNTIVGPLSDVLSERSEVRPRFIDDDSGSLQ